jgi:hypothetical protein
MHTGRKVGILTGRDYCPPGSKEVTYASGGYLYFLQKDVQKLVSTNLSYSNFNNIFYKLSKILRADEALFLCRILLLTY